MTTSDDQDLVRIQKVEALQTALKAAATNDPGDTEGYPALRRELLRDPVVGPRLPEFVRRYPDLDQFWPYIKDKFPTYAERRAFIWDAFRPILDTLTGRTTHPAAESVSIVLAGFDREHVHAVWRKAIDRLTNDPAGAITAARTLLESVCKHILDNADIAYGEADLPRLYRLASEQLKLAPNQHSEQIFKQILGGCQSVVEGLGAVRNSPA